MKEEHIHRQKLNVAGSSNYNVLVSARVASAQGVTMFLHVIYSLSVRPNVLTRVSNGCIVFVQSPLSLVELEYKD